MSERIEARSILDLRRRPRKWLLASALALLAPAALGRPAADPPVAGIPAAGTTVQRDGQHDFDFEFGSWNVHIRRLLHPLSGEQSWTDLDGTSVVRKVWEGRGNLGELEVSNPSTRLEGLSLRLYNPESRQWNIYWANSRDGNLGTPMTGRFSDGRGEFYNQELFQGTAILVRFIFSDISATTFRLEQAFSPDGGKTWEANWIASFRRHPPES